MTNLGVWWESRYLELEPTDLAMGAVLAILVGGALLYFIVKVLRSRIFKLLTAGVALATLVLIGWFVIDQRAQGERERMSQIWSRTFDDSAITDFESCVANRSPAISGTRSRVDLVTECGEVAKAIKQGLEAR